MTDRNLEDRLPLNPLRGVPHLSPTNDPSLLLAEEFKCTSLASPGQSGNTTSSPRREAEAKMDPSEFCKPAWLTQKMSFRDVIDPFLIMNYGKNAAHVLLYSKARDSDLILGSHPQKHRVLVRFDGKFGFPGGIIDEIQFDEDAVDDSADFNEFLGTVMQGLKREVREELMMSIEFEPKYVFSAVPKAELPSKLVTILHFFTAEISLEKMEEIERNFSSVLTSDEVLGLTRVPLYNLSGENYPGCDTHGLPTFLTNTFAGNSVEQLLRGCLKENLLTVSEIKSALTVADALMKRKANFE